VSKAREPKSSVTAADTVVSIRVPMVLAVRWRADAEEAGQSVSEHLRCRLEEEPGPKGDTGVTWPEVVARRLERSLQGILDGWMKAKLGPMIRKQLDEGMPF